MVRIEKVVFSTHVLNILKERFELLRELLNSKQFLSFLSSLQFSFAHLSYIFNYKYLYFQFSPKLLREKTGGTKNEEPR